LIVRISVVTDEIAESFEEALNLCEELGVSTVELRRIGEQNIVFLDNESILKIRAELQRRGLSVCCIASPFLKSPLWTQSAEREQEWMIFERSLIIAKLLDAPLVRTFSFLRADDPLSVRETVRDAIAEAVRRVEAAGLKLVIENEHACNVGTGEEAGWLLREIPSPAFGVTWDPGNEARMGSRPFPEGYQHVRGRIFNVHLKDVDTEGRWVIVGQGTIDYTGQFRALVEDQYAETVALEPHYAYADGGKERAARESFAAIQNLLREAGATLS
jgi:sugar phosphate isomerase/epimerase